MVSWGGTPPDITSPKLWTGLGAGTIIAAGAALDVLAATLTSTGAAGLAVNTTQAIAWAGMTGEMAAASQMPHLAWEPTVGGLLTAAGQQMKLAGEAFEEARLATPTPAEIAGNQAEHVALQQANIPAMGMLTPFIIRNRGTYFGDYWVRTATNMYTYMAKSGATMGGLEYPPPPPPSTLGGAMPGPMDSSAASALESPAGGGMGQLTSFMQQGMSAAQPAMELPKQMSDIVTKVPQEFSGPLMQALQQATSMSGGSFGGDGASLGDWAMTPQAGGGPVGAQFGSGGAGGGAGGGLGGLRTPGAWSSGTLNASSVSNQTAEGTGASRFAEARTATANAGGGAGGPGMMAPMARRDKRDEQDAQRSPAWAAAEEILYREPEHVPVVWGVSGAQPHRGGEE